MTAVTLKRLQEVVQLGTSDPVEGSGKYTSPTGTKTVIQAANAVNVSAGVAKLTVSMVPPSGSVGNNRVIKDLSMAAGESYQCPELINQILEAGGFVSAKSDTASAIEFTMSGAQIS